MKKRRVAAMKVRRRGLSRELARSLKIRAHDLAANLVQDNALLRYLRERPI